MGAKIKAIFVVLILSLVFLHSKSPALAEPAACSALTSGFSVSSSNWPQNPITNGSYAPATLVIHLGTGYADGTYKVMCSHDTSVFMSYADLDEIYATSTNKTLTATFPTNKCFTFNADNAGAQGDMDVYVKIEQVDATKTPPQTIGTPCSAYKYTIKGYAAMTCGPSNFSIKTTADGLSGCFAPADQITWTISNLKNSDGSIVNGPFSFTISGTNINTTANIVNGSATGTGAVTGAAASQMQAQLKPASNALMGCTASLTTIKIACTPEDRAGTGPGTNSGTGNGATGVVPFDLCSQAAADDLDDCKACVSTGNITDPNDANQKFWTAFGCVSVTKEGIVTSLLRIGIGLSGGFVLLSILYGAFLLTTSSGDPTRVKEGQEMITSAIMGLLFVIFSIIILQFIGVTLLRIPGFGT